MSDRDVRIIKLEPMRVVSFLGFGASPEALAWNQLTEWAKPRGFLKESEKHPIFGFNNPNPSPGSPNYGYELWMGIEPGDLTPTDAVETKDFAGGLYAVMRCVVPKGDFGVIGSTWQKLSKWLEGSAYKFGSHQWLEKTVPCDLPDIEFVLDLYLPIAG
ncbi:MAG TPA: GyrI-like domain-containing protein [Anaerolineaceae bacterium]|nr:GyrI-like domain-containing protein [Anaerolineaceae bacterium]